ncbi:hypothetical protein [Nostoc sp. 'Peltigera membranacea cyanobiont' N6]|uniref:hypothetical protein n=1 Tax=Nostoc sp. 'Peltigera membranacea cyanobiont' N6 TaxID=1261031 RepID=UPI002157783F|nr:hypothetical protein [Nostoc sp. 'Peltigera membranacea cyanobiont' N6]
MRIIFETDGGKEVSNSTVTSLDETVDTSSSANWGYAIATSVLIAAMVIPQVSGWIESQVLVKDINLESVYLNLEYPFSVDHLFNVIPISFSFYYQQDWQNIISKLSDGYNRLLVIDSFDRLHFVSNTFSDDLFRLQQLAQLENFSLLLISRMPLEYFHFSGFANYFERLELNETNTWTLGQ